MHATLTAEEKNILRLVHRGTKKKRDADKIKAALLSSEGYSAAQIAAILLLDDDTVRSWLVTYAQAPNLATWLRSNHLAYRGKLSESEREQVVLYVQENVISDSKQVKAFIEDHFVITYSLSGITVLLNTLGFVYKKTTLIPSKYDPIRQAQCKEMYETMEHQLATTETILFMDSVHPQHNTTCTYAWIKKGETKEMKSNTGRQRVNWNGVYNPTNQDVLFHASDTINADAVIAFLKRIEDCYSHQEKISIILDNARYYRNAKVTAYVQSSRIELVFLPPYSPNLNLIERLWKFIRKKVINNQYYETFSDFKKALFNCANNLTFCRQELKQFIGTKMHLFPTV